MGMGAERQQDVGSLVLAGMDWRGTRDVCMADKVVGGVMAGCIWRADLERISQRDRWMGDR